MECVLKVILKRVFFVMALVSIRTRTKCLSFENVFKFERCFLKVLVFVVENSKDVWFEK